MRERERLRVRASEPAQAIASKQARTSDHVSHSHISPFSIFILEAREQATVSASKQVRARAGEQARASESKREQARASGRVRYGCMSHWSIVRAREQARVGASEVYIHIYVSESTWRYHATRYIYACLPMYTHTYIPIYLYTCIHTFIYMYVYISFLYMYLIFIHIYLYVYIYTYTYICIYIYIHCIHVYVKIYVYMYTFTYIYIICTITANRFEKKIQTCKPRLTARGINIESDTTHTKHFHGS